MIKAPKDVEEPETYKIPKDSTRTYRDGDETVTVKTKVKKPDESENKVLDAIKGLHESGEKYANDQFERQVKDENSRRKDKQKEKAEEAEKDVKKTLEKVEEKNEDRKKE